MISRQPKGVFMEIIMGKSHKDLKKGLEEIIAYKNGKITKGIYRPQVQRKATQ